MRYLGDFIRGQTVRFHFNSQTADGASATFTGTTVSVYKDGSATQSTTGVTLTKDFDSLTGIHLVEVALSDAFYADGSDFSVVLAGATVDGQTVNAVLASFSIRNRPTAGVLARGTAQAGAATTITLASGASATDDLYNSAIVSIVSGTGAGQTRIVADYVGSTKVATVDAAWATNPDSTSVYELLPLGIVGLSATQVAQAIWNAVAASYNTANSMGAKLNSAGASADPWAVALPGTYVAGTAGAILGNNLNATVSSRASQASVDAVDDLVDTEVAAIKAKTDQLTFTSGAVQADIKRINGTTVNGNGAGTPWGP